ncbi:MAG: hypothetical protein JKY65_07265 [Planctomycetes bacterium]|nr:hypothetical protein [Planctomycetota bacterium]
MSEWARPAAYSYKGGRSAKAKRKKAFEKSAQKGGRNYLNRSEPNMDLVSPFGRTLSTTSTTPLVVAVDVTGSMASWPAEIFDRLPLLYQTLSQYRPDLEISFAAIGDATSDSYPLQITDFAAGVELEDQLNAIYGEGGGGGGARESYELFAYFLLTKVRAPNAQRPYLIIYGDEGFYPEVSSSQLRYYLGGREKRNRDSVDVWKALSESWNVFHLRKDYGPHKDAEIEAQWAEAIGPERIVSLRSAERAVDLALGLVARGWGHFEDFEENLSARQPKSATDMIRERVSAVGDLR